MEDISISVVSVDLLVTIVLVFLYVGTDMYVYLRIKGLKDRIKAIKREYKQLATKVEELYTINSIKEDIKELPPNEENKEADSK